MIHFARDTVTQSGNRGGHSLVSVENVPREMSQNGFGSSLRDALGYILSKFEDLIFIDLGSRPQYVRSRKYVLQRVHIHSISEYQLSDMACLARIFYEV